ncbi:sensor histidine kinase [Agriterribacter sp.]|uniref:sensor histidine kinase n=1 Tax=Agriterribacter sp. TaxID=2821509 RepID=UPI002CFE0A2B|nr:histidine kinase [Agriterribacter sp.]HTN05124.1 histidine kinase [Agriterribacter sp.]
MAALLIESKNKQLIIGLHLAGWFMYGALMNLTHRLSTPTVTITDTVSALIPYILTFYVSLACFHLLKAKRFVVGVAVFVVVFITMSGIGYFYVYWFLPRNGIVLFLDSDFGLFLSQAIWGFFYMFFSAALYYIIPLLLKNERKLRITENEKMQQELENVLLKQQELKAQQEKLQYENAFVRSQINPHFLLNTLNVLFSQALPHSEMLAANIRKLSEMMRYSLDSIQFESDKVPVQRELDNLKTLIEINEMRFPSAKVIDYRIEGEAGSQMVPPLSLTTIVENAFKYGDLKDPGNPLQIKVVFHPEQFYFYCRNKKRKQKNNIEISSYKIGLSNLRRRLDVSFKGRYLTKVEDEEDFYTFELTINAIHYD